MPAPSLVTLTHRFKRTIHVGWEDPVLLPAGMLVMIFLVLRWLMFNGTALPAEAYHERLLIWEFAANLIKTPVALALSGLLVLAVGVRWRKALKEWGAFDHSPALRAVVIASAAVIV